MAIGEWLSLYLATAVGLEAEQVEWDKSFARFGLDSVALIAMSGELAEWLDCTLDDSVVYEYSTVETLSQHLAARQDVLGSFTTAVGPAARHGEPRSSSNE